MTPEQEKQLLQALYDRLFDAITYVPQGGGVNPFDKKETFIHFTKNEALQPSAFADAWNPTNPNADLGASELFAKMVDKVSPMSLEWAPKDQSLAEAYKSIVEGMNEAKSARPSQAAIDAYDKAKAYLQKSEVNPFTKAIVTGGVSDEYQAYLKNLQALTEAYTDYSSRYNTFVDDVVDAEAANDANAKKRAQREWNTDEKSLRREISNAQANLTAGNSKWVQMALDTMNTTINDAFARARDSAVAQVADDQFNAGTAGARWLLTYANPTNWYDPNATDNFSELTISSKNKVDDNSTTTHGYTFGADYNGGIWSAGAKSEGEFKNTQHHMKADEISIKCKIAKVSIVRPWFDETLFRSDNWFTNLKGEDETLYISNGKLDSTNADNVLPMYPIAFIVARDIEITANFTKEDQEIISQSASASARASYGPFSISGGYKYGNETDHFESNVSDGKLKVPGMQVIGWVSRALPPSPKRSRKVLDA
jgi:hypothetical protein